MTRNPNKGVGTVSAQIAALPALPMAELWALWDQHFPRRPKHINRPFLESRLAYRIQEMAFGGPSSFRVDRNIDNDPLVAGVRWACGQVACRPVHMSTGRYFDEGARS